MNIDGPDLEDRYRQVLRLLPGYYRAAWEEDMVAAFLDSRMTGDELEDEYTLEFGKPTWPEVASVAALAARLYLGGVGTPLRYFAWGQAVRGAVLAVLLVHAVQRLNDLVLIAWSRHPASWLPALPPSLMIASPGDGWPTVWNTIDDAWILVFVALVLGHFLTARVIAALALVPYPVVLLQAQFAGTIRAPFGDWAYWVLLDLAPVLAMAAFHRDAPPPARRPWLLALPAGYLLMVVPLLALQATGNSAWLPDFAGLCCVLVALACLMHAPRALSRRAAGSGVWSLTLVLLAAFAGTYRIASLGNYMHDPHLITVSLAELLILLAAVALVASDAGRAQAAAPAPPLHPRLG
jgi:hypothetical protein